MENQIAKLKLYLFILAFAFFVQLFFSILYFRHSNYLHTSSFSNIESLIDELGNLRNENQQLTEKFSQNIADSRLEKELLFRLDKSLSNAQNSALTATEIGLLQKDLQVYANSLNQENIRLKNSLGQKDQELADMSREREHRARLAQADENMAVFLLLGQNEQLTDSIQLVFANSSLHKLTFVSVPRDLFYEGRKINEFLRLYGPEKLKSVLAGITGFQVDRFLSVDFTAFQDIIDSLGGIDILIDKDIVDNQYPDGISGYKTVVFTSSDQPQHLNGEHALEYARTRKSTSDFDRSLRQQKILLSVRNKLISKSVLENADFYLSVYDSIKNSLSSDLNVFEALHFFDLYKNYSVTAGNILSTENYLYSSKSATGQSILLPLNNSFEAFQKKLLEIV